MNKFRVNCTWIIAIIIVVMVSSPLFARTHSEKRAEKKVMKIYNDFELIKQQGDKLKVDMFNYTLEDIERINSTNSYKVTYILQEEINKTFDNLEKFKEFGDKLELNELQYTLMTLKRISNTEKLIATYVLEQ